jgi:DNA-binding CsgD family transcriptional regulator
MQKEIHSLFAEETFLRRFDIVFGLFNIVQVIGAVIDHLTNGSPVSSIISMSLFFVVNAGLSAISYWSETPHRAEKVRIILGMLLAPIVFTWQSGTFGPWWAAYYIMTIGGVTFLCVYFQKVNLALALIACNAITSAAMEMIIFHEPVFVILNDVGLFIIVNLIYVLVLSLIQNSLAVVIELQKANDSIVKLREENHRLKEFELLQMLQNKDKELAVYSLSVIHKNRLMEDIKNDFYGLKVNKLGDDGRKIEGITKKLEDGFKFDKDWHEFKTYYEGIHKDFFKILKANYPELTSSDLKLCALIKLNLNSKEIARILGVLPESIKTGRYRIRKKVKLKPTEDLFNFLNNIETTEETA